MYKSSIYISLIVIILAISPIESYAQSLKGKTWQSQDITDYNYEPSTIVANPDGTFKYLEYRYVGKKLFGPILYEGKITETKYNVKMSVYQGANIIAIKSYTISWINNTEFILTEGIKKHRYVELGSESDIFTPKFLLTLLKEKIELDKPIDDCYSNLVIKLKDTETTDKQTQTNTSNKLTETLIPEEFFSTVSGKVFTLIHDNYTVTYDFRLDGTYNYKLQQKLSDEIYTYEENGLYTQVKDEIMFTPNKWVSIDSFNGGGSVSEKGDNKEKYNAKISWVNDFMFRMKYNNIKRLFKAI